MRALAKPSRSRLAVETSSAVPEDVLEVSP
jgi:hypothetical protein